MICFSRPSLIDLLISSDFFVCVFLHYFKKIFLKGLYQLHNVILNSCSSASSDLGCSGFSVVRLADSVGTILLFRLLNVFLHWHLSISFSI